MEPILMCPIFSNYCPWSNITIFNILGIFLKPWETLGSTARAVFDNSKKKNLNQLSCAQYFQNYCPSSKTKN